MWRSAVVHVAMLAVEAFAAEGLHVHGHSVARFYMGHLLSHFLHYAHHLVANGNSRHGTRHGTVLDMQIAGTDAAQRYSNDGIVLISQCRLLLLREAKHSLFNISKCFHSLKLLK